MARKGTRFAYRIRFAYRKTSLHSRSAHSIEEAAQNANELQNLGARVSLWWIDPRDPDRKATLIQHLDVTAPAPHGYRLCPSCGGAFPVDLDSEDYTEEHKPFTTHAHGGKYGKCETEIGLDEIDEAERIDAHHGETVESAERAAHRMNHKTVIGEAFTGDGEKVRLYHLTPDVAAWTLQPWRNENEKIAAELLRMVNDPTNYSADGVFDSDALLRRAAALRAL